MARDRSIQRMLLLRLAVAALAVSAVTAVVVASRESGRTEELAADRAAQGAAMLRLSMLEQLDAGLPDHAAVQRLLDRVHGSPAGAASGRFVILAVQDASGVEVARIADPGRSVAGTKGLIPVVVPLRDSAGRVAGHVDAWFEVSGRSGPRRDAGSPAPSRWGSGSSSPPPRSSTPSSPA